MVFAWRPADALRCVTPAHDTLAAFACEAITSDITASGIMLAREGLDAFFILLGIRPLRDHVNDSHKESLKSYVISFVYRASAHSRIQFE
jgi:hypothetical protein